MASCSNTAKNMEIDPEESVTGEHNPIANKGGCWKSSPEGESPRDDGTEWHGQHFDSSSFIGLSPPEEACSVISNGNHE
nr:hypothetical protein Iba_chr14fCG7400 [Ipomoea batatas]